MSKKCVTSLDKIKRNTRWHLKNTTNTTASKNGRQRIERSNSDSARWIAGLLLLFVGVFAASSVLFSFFSWAADQSGLQLA